MEMPVGLTGDPISGEIAETTLGEFADLLECASGWTVEIGSGLSSITAIGDDSWSGADLASVVEEVADTNHFCYSITSLTKTITFEEC
jgi:hypothetical protein